MPQPPAPSQETAVDIFALSPNSVKALGQAALAQAFFEGTSSIILRAQEMGLVDEGRMPLATFLDVIDERLHGGDDISDPDLSKKLDAIFHLTSLSAVKKQVSYEEIEVTVTEDEVEYHKPEEPDSADSTLLRQRFLEERAQKRAKEEAERAARPQRRLQARRQTLEKRAQAQSKEATRLGDLHRADIENVIRAWIVNASIN